MIWSCLHDPAQRSSLGKVCCAQLSPKLWRACGNPGDLSQLLPCKISPQINSSCAGGRSPRSPAWVFPRKGKHSPAWLPPSQSQSHMYSQFTYHNPSHWFPGGWPQYPEEPCRRHKLVPAGLALFSLYLVNQFHAASRVGCPHEPQANISSSF